MKECQDCREWFPLGLGAYCFASTTISVKRLKLSIVKHVWCRVVACPPPDPGPPPRGQSAFFPTASRGLKSVYHATVVRFRCQCRLRGPDAPRHWASNYAHELVSVYHFHSAHLCDSLTQRKSCWHTEVRAKFSIEPIIKPTIYWRIAVDMRRGTVCPSKHPQAA